MASRKKPITPRSRVRQALRRVWMTSRERSAALKRDGYCCQSCGRKQSKAKGKEFAVECHHISGIDNWEEVIDIIYRRLLCGPDKLVTLCPECHDREERDAKNASGGMI